MSEYARFVRERMKTYPADMNLVVEGTHPADHGLVLNGLALSLHHATTGMMGEAIELECARTRADLFEELGDFEFYLQALASLLGLEKFDPYSATLVPWLEALTILRRESACALDLTKKLWIYNKPLDRSLARALRVHGESCIDGLLSLCEQLGVDRSEIQHLNMVKLRKRYPEGYTDTAAQARADKESME